MKDIWMFIAVYTISSSGLSRVVTFDSKEGSAVTPQNISSGGKINKPANPTKTGQYFLGWYTDEALTDRWDFEIDRAAGSMTLYARWNAEFIALSVDDLSEYLKGKTGTIETPLNVKAEMPLANDDWINLLFALYQAEVYVNLDLTNCTAEEGNVFLDLAGSVEGWLKQIKTIRLPDELTYIGEYAFYNADFTQITLPNRLTSIGAGAINDCKNLTQITLPAALTSIGYSAFVNCTSLAEVTCLAVKPPALDMRGFQPFADASPDLKIKVPAASLTAYQAAEGWTAYVDKIIAIQ